MIFDITQRESGDSVVLNCSHGNGFSVLDVVEVVKRAAQTSFPVPHGLVQA